MPNEILTIELNNNADEAYLLLPAQFQATPELILHVINENKICFGLDFAAVQAACTACNTEQRIIIARGQKPQNSTPSTLTSSLDLDGDTIVSAGQLIGEIQEYQKGTPGMNIFGKAISHTDCSEILPISSGLEMRKHEIFASIDGTLFQDRNGLWNVSAVHRSPIELHSIELELSDDLFTAKIVLDAHHWLSPQVLLQAIQAKKVSFGFIQEALESILETQSSQRDIIVACGQLPIDGPDARLENLLIIPYSLPLAQVVPSTIDRHRFLKTSNKAVN